MLEEFFPITSEIGFFERDAQGVARAYEKWHEPILARLRAELHSETVEGRLDRVLSRLLPLTSPIRERFLFLETTTRWSAYLDNFRTGTDATTPVHYLTKQLRCRGVRLSLVADRSREDAGTILEVCQANGDRRSIFCAKDGARWKFGQTGEPLPFEDTRRYRAKSVLERFTPELAEEYLRALGLEASRESLEPGGHARGVLLTRRGPRPSSFREYSVEWTVDPPSRGLGTG